MSLDLFNESGTDGAEYWRKVVNEEKVKGGLHI